MSFSQNLSENTAFCEIGHAALYVCVCICVSIHIYFLALSFQSTNLQSINLLVLVFCMLDFKAFPLSSSTCFSITK